MRRTIREADLNDYLYFAVAVEHGGFAAASRALNIPKSKLSRRIAGLENRLGVRLIERSTRRFRVTELGRTFYERCRSILDEAEEAEAAVAEARTDPHGDVRVSCPTGLMKIVSPALPQFLRRFPKVRLHLVASDRPMDLIEDGIDVAIRVRTKLDDSAALTVRMLGISRKILVASPDYASGLGGSIDDIAAATTLGTSEEAGENEWSLVAKEGATRRIKHEPRLRSGDFVVVRQAAIEGLGIALLPDHLCREEIAEGKLVQVFDDWRAADGVVHLVFTTRRGLPVAVRAFIDHLVAAFRPEMLSHAAS